MFAIPALLRSAETAPSGPFDLIGGLPVHALVVHSVVVLVPLSFLGLLLIVIAPRLRKALGWIVLLLLAVASGLSWVSIQSGEQLASRVGEPAAHANAGELMLYLIPSFFVITALWYLSAQLGAARRNRKDRQAAAAAAAPIGIDPLTGRPLDGPAPAPVPQGGGAFSALLAVLALAVGLLSVIWTIRVGHTGATATWADVVAGESGVTASPSPTAIETPTATASPTESPTSTPTETPTALGTPQETGTPTAAGAPADLAIFAMSDVRAHATVEDCWAVVDGNVYDLTQWVDAHPGGSGPIAGLCGTDATAQFRAQHAMEGDPNSQLDAFQIGTLSTES